MEDIIHTDRTGNLLATFALALSDRISEATAAAAGAGHSVPAAIIQIGTFPGESLDALRISLGLSQPATTRVVDRLESAGLINRGQGIDGRFIALTLTEAGHSTMRAVLAARRAEVNRVLNRVQPADQLALASILERMIHSMVHSASESDLVCRLCELEVCPQDVCPASFKEK